MWLRNRSGRTLVLGSVCVGTLVLSASMAFHLCSQTAIADQAAASQNTQSTGSEKLQNGELSLSYSRVYVFVDKSGLLGHEHGVEGRLTSGMLQFDGDPAFGELVFDMTSFTADTSAARKYVGLPGTTDPGTQSKVTANMKSADVLNVRRYPTAKFVVKSIAPLSTTSRRGLPQYQIDGDFTLCGRTRPIKITADAEQKNGWLHVRGGFSILQTQFGITPYSIGLGAVGVADRLKIWGDLWVADRQNVIGQRAGAKVQ